MPNGRKPESVCHFTQTWPYPYFLLASSIVRTAGTMIHNGYFSRLLSPGMTNDCGYPGPKAAYRVWYAKSFDPESLPSG